MKSLKLFLLLNLFYSFQINAIDSKIQEELRAAIQQNNLLKVQELLNKGKIDLSYIYPDTELTAQQEAIKILNEYEKFKETRDKWFRNALVLVITALSAKEFLKYKKRKREIEHQLKFGSMAMYQKSGLTIHGPIFELLKSENAWGFILGSYISKKFLNRYGADQIATAKEIVSLLEKYAKKSKANRKNSN